MIFDEQCNTAFNSAHSTLQILKCNILFQIVNSINVNNPANDCNCWIEQTINNFKIGIIVAKTNLQHVKDVELEIWKVRKNWLEI